MGLRTRCFRLLMLLSLFFATACDEGETSKPDELLHRETVPGAGHALERGESPSLVDRAESLYRAGQFDQSLRILEVVLQADPENKQAYLTRARVLLEQGKLGEALCSLDSAILIDPAFSDAKFERAHVYAMQNNFEQAHRDLTSIIDSSESGFSVWVGRAIVNLQLGAYSDAVRDAKAATRAHVSETVAHIPHVLLAQMLAALPDDDLRDGDLALAHAESAYHYAGDKSPHVLGSLAMAYAELGDYTLAVQWQRKAVAAAKEPLLARYRNYLACYESQKPCRVSGPALADAFGIW